MLANKETTTQREREREREGGRTRGVTWRKETTEKKQFQESPCVYYLTSESLQKTQKPGNKF